MSTGEDVATVRFADLVREQFPEATDDEAASILWNYTGYPSFWAGDPVDTCRAQLRRLKELGADAIDAERDADNAAAVQS